MLLWSEEKENHRCQESTTAKSKSSPHQAACLFSSLYLIAGRGVLLAIEVILNKPDTGLTARQGVAVSYSYPCDSFLPGGT